MIIINLDRRLQNGVTIGQVSKNWRWESRISELRTWLTANPAIHFSHVKRTSNNATDFLANKEVDKKASFHAEEINNNKDGSLWKCCEEVAEADVWCWQRKTVGPCQGQMSVHPRSLEDSCNHLLSPSLPPDTLLHMPVPHVIDRSSPLSHVIQMEASPLPNSVSDRNDNDETNSPLGIYSRNADDTARTSGKRLEETEISDGMSA